jgi:outer membrane lipoprotein-sorting protein
MRLTRSAFVLATLVMLLFVSSIASQEDLSLEQILDAAYQKQQESEEKLQDYTCQTTLVMREPQKDGTSKTLRIEEKTIYHKPPDKYLEKYTAITDEDKVLSPEEVAEYQKKAQREAAKNQEKEDKKSANLEFGANSPFSPEERPNYDFQLLPADTIRGMPSYVLKIMPKQKRVDLMDGTVWLHRDIFETIKMDFHPAKNPRFVKKVHMIMDFDEIQPGFWLPTELKIDACGGILFIKKSFQMHQTWRNYQLNVALSDSLFVTED